MSMVEGRVFDIESRAPIPRAHVRVPSLNIQLEADSLGQFAFPAPRREGCYIVQAMFIGYGGTYRSVQLPVASHESLELPLRTAAIPEWRALYLQQCRPRDAVLFQWGADTVAVQ